MNTYDEGNPAKGLSKLQKEILLWVLDAGQSVEDHAAQPQKIRNDFGFEFETEAIEWGKYDGAGVWAVRSGSRGHFGYTPRTTSTGRRLRSVDSKLADVGEVTLTTRSSKELVSVHRAVGRLVKRGLVERIEIWRRYWALTPAGLATAQALAAEREDDDD